MLKKLFLIPNRTILICVGIFLSLPMFVSATSGACSDHKGVNLYAGPGADGGVICFDNWPDSSVKFYDMVGSDKWSPTLYSYIRVNRIAPISLPDYNQTYNSAYNNCMQSKYQDTRYIDRLNICSQQAQTIAFTPSCPANSNTWTDTLSGQSYCVCLENYHDENGKCLAGKAIDLNESLQKGLDDFNKKLNQILPPTQPKQIDPKPNNSVNNQTLSEQLKLPKSVKPKSSPVILNNTQLQTIQVPEKKPSVIRRIINFFKTLF